MSDTADTPPDYLDALHIFYSERLKAGLKKKFYKCKGCEDKKQFIIKEGKLYYTCGSTTGDCGLQLEITLAKYLYYPEAIYTQQLVRNMIDKSKHPDLYSESDIKEYKEFIEDSDSILKQATKDFIKLNKLNDRSVLIQKTHRDRINHKKEQNLLMKKIQEETDLGKKRSLMRDYLVINKQINENYMILHETCNPINNFVVVEKGSASKESDTFEGITKKKEKKLGKAIDKNLITELQGLVKQPKNDMIMNVIVAYRDPGDGTRKAQLKQFKEQMNLIFKDQTDIRIYIIEQEGSRDDYGTLPKLIQQPNSDMAKFNLGILKNIGFDIASKSMKNKKNAYYILSDVDLLPSENLVTDYLRFPENPIHLGNKGTRYNMDGKDQSFLGGVISVNKQDFVKANGYPNNFWGWGGEDNALNRRLRDSKIKVYKSTEPVIDLEKLTLDEKLTKLRTEKTKEMRKIEKLEQDKSTWKENGLSSLEGTYKITKKLKAKNITHIRVFLNVDTSAKQ